MGFSKTKDRVRKSMFSEDGLEFPTSHAYRIANATFYRTAVEQWCKERDIKIENIGFASGGHQNDRYYFQHWKCKSKEDVLKVLLVWG